MADTNRYSQTVAWVKVVLPLAALGLLSTLFLFSNSPDPERAIPFADVDVEELAREQRLSQPRFAGTLSDGREVLFTANTAAPVPGTTDRISAETVEARVALSDTGYILLSSGQSLVDLGSRRVDLSGGVRVTASNGYRIQSDEMVVSLDVMNILSPGPVQVDGPALTLTADRMELSGDAGSQVLIFNGSVRMLYSPDS